MKFYRILTGVFIIVSLFWLGTVVNADDPPKSATDAPQVASTRTAPEKGSFLPVPIQPGHAVLDPATANITHLEPAIDNRQTVVAPKVTPTISSSTLPGKGSFVPLPVEPAHIGPGKPLPTNLDDATLDPGGQDVLRRASLGATASTLIMYENFDSDFITGGDWSRSSSTSHYWDDVNCFPVESSGVGSAWAADDFVGDTPCAENYANNMNSWLVYGPFSLADAQSSTLDFYFRLASESNYDYLNWGASTDGLTFYGRKTSGTFTSGPYNNGYNFVSFDLTNVDTLGNLAGQSEVWIAFWFTSDADVVEQGPFIDNITLWKNTDATVYLTDENFDISSFPNAAWESSDYSGAGVYWDDVMCWSKSGAWSMWPADNGINSRDTCAGQDYVNNMYSWVIHGPFDLTGASEAWVDFYFRIISESCDPITACDYLFWGASVDEVDFYGSRITGTYIGGPYNNGYNGRRFYLSNVPSLGDLRGQSQVWLAFIFKSDGSVTDQGPFIDDVSVVVERVAAAPSSLNTVYLPVVIKSETAKTKLFIDNQTGATINNYTVFNPQLNGAAIPDIVCANIPAGATKFNCTATFDSGIHQVSSTNSCTPPVTTGQVFFSAGDEIRVVRCR